MSFAVLSVVCLVALLGPLLALDERRQVPVVVGELAAGIALGHTGFGYLDAGDPTFAFLGSVGFALVMFVAGTHVPVGGWASRRCARPWSGWWSSGSPPSRSGTPSPGSSGPGTAPSTRSCWPRAALPSCSPSSTPSACKGLP